MTDVTQILQSWSQQSRDDRGRVVAALYDELRRNAANHLRGERGVVDLQPTSLVNEAYFRLVNIDRIDLNGRSHFLGLAGRIMREVLVDEARKLRASKRDQALQTHFTGDFDSGATPLTDILQVDELLNELEAIDPQYVQLFEARAFAGMTIEEAAQMLDLSVSTVKRKWKVVMAWLREKTG
ncbi:MAG: sigma-70 family RNA polymerase sigma factor [Pseudomonadales bacterium]|nr:sigma-70 family RNA polymerase sigma factor [Pseudomonadales bacterium]MCP5183265.1 sigma-70 family RNA polymerase sigma factor [Pseudomonadales bacterium]